MNSNDIALFEVARLALANDHWREMIGEILDLSNHEMDYLQRIAEQRLNTGETA
jgi:hypothetical protein